MGAHWLHDLPAVLAAVPDVSTYAGWENRSRSSGGYDSVLGVVIHHTASNTSPESDMRYMWDTADDGPIGAIYLGRDGRVVVGAAGATNTQGKGGPLHLSRGTVPLDKGNQHMIAVEAASSGTPDAVWPEVQTTRYVELVRALCDGYGLDPAVDVHSHFSYCAPSCPSRKIDPAGPSPFGSVNSAGSWDVGLFRAAVLGALPPVPPEPTPTPPEPTPPEPTPTPPEEDFMAALPTIRKGDSGDYVERMQHLLAAAGDMDPGNVSNYDGVWGNGTDGAKSRFDAAHGLGGSDTSCGPKSWESLMTGRVW